MDFNVKNDVEVQEIADYFIGFCHEHGDVITNLKLQKLLYYAQGWYLGLKGKPLFENRIEAWIHGPVVPDVYHRFKVFSYNPITENIGSPQFLEEEVEFHLKEIIKVYGGCGAYELELMTHREDPWIKARGKLPLDIACNNEITLASMKKYFASIAEE